MPPTRHVPCFPSPSPGQEKSVAPLQLALGTSETEPKNDWPFCLALALAALATLPFVLGLTRGGCGLSIQRQSPQEQG